MFSNLSKFLFGELVFSWYYLWGFVNFIIPFFVVYVFSIDNSHKSKFVVKFIAFYHIILLVIFNLVKNSVPYTSYYKARPYPDIMGLIIIIIFIILIPSVAHYKLYLTYNKYETIQHIQVMFFKYGLIAMVGIITSIMLKSFYPPYPKNIISKVILYKYPGENSMNGDYSYSEFFSNALDVRIKIDEIPWSASKDDVKRLSKARLINESDKELKYLHLDAREKQKTILTYSFNDNDKLYKITCTIKIYSLDFTDDTVTFISGQGSDHKYPYIINKSKVIEDYVSNITKNKEKKFLLPNEEQVNLDEYLSLYTESLDQKILLPNQKSYKEFIKELDKHETIKLISEGKLELSFLHEYESFSKHAFEKSPYSYKYDLYTLSTLKQIGQDNDIVLEVTFFNPLSLTR